MIEFFGTLIPTWLMAVLVLAIAGHALVSLFQYYRDSKEFWKSLENDDKEDDFNEK